MWTIDFLRFKSMLWKIKKSIWIPFVFAWNIFFFESESNIMWLNSLKTKVAFFLLWKKIKNQNQWFVSVFCSDTQKKRREIWSVCTVSASIAWQRFYCNYLRAFRLWNVSVCSSINVTQFQEMPQHFSIFHYFSHPSFAFNIVIKWWFFTSSTFHIKLQF